MGIKHDPETDTWWQQKDTLRERLSKWSEWHWFLFFAALVAIGFLVGPAIRFVRDSWPSIRSAIEPAWKVITSRDWSGVGMAMWFLLGLFLLSLAMVALYFLWDSLQNWMKCNLPVKTARQRAIMSVLTTEKCGQIIFGLVLGYFVPGLLAAYVASILLGQGGDYPAYSGWIFGGVGAVWGANMFLGVIVAEESGPLCELSATRSQSERRMKRLDKLSDSDFRYDQIEKTISKLSPSARRECAAIVEVAMRVGKKCEQECLSLAATNATTDFYLANKASENACSAFLVARLFDPQHVEAHYSLGRVYQMRGANEPAIREYSETLRLCPKHVNALLGRARVRESVGEWASAIADYTEILGLNPDDAHARAAIESIHKRTPH